MTNKDMIEAVALALRVQLRTQAGMRHLDDRVGDEFHNVYINIDDLAKAAIQAMQPYMGELRQEIERLTAEPSEAEMISNTLKSREDRLINKFKSQEYCHSYIERYIELRLSAFLRAASKKHSNSLDMTIREILRLALADGKVVICQVVTASEFIKLTQILEGAALGKLAAEPSEAEIEAVAKTLVPELWAHENEQADFIDRATAMTSDAARARGNWKRRTKAALTTFMDGRR